MRIKPVSATPAADLSAWYRAHCAHIRRRRLEVSDSTFSFTCNSSKRRWSWRIRVAPMEEYECIRFEASRELPAAPNPRSAACIRTRTKGVRDFRESPHPDLLLLVVYPSAFGETDPRCPRFQTGRHRAARRPDCDGVQERQ